MKSGMPTTLTARLTTMGPATISRAKISRAAIRRQNQTPEGFGLAKERLTELCSDRGRPALPHAVATMWRGSPSRRAMATERWQPRRGSCVVIGKSCDRGCA